MSFTKNSNKEINVCRFRRYEDITVYTIFIDGFVREFAEIEYIFDINEDELNTIIQHSNGRLDRTGNRQNVYIIFSNVEDAKQFVELLETLAIVNKMKNR